MSYPTVVAPGLHVRPTPIHASNAWNPTGRNLAPVPGTYLYYTHVDALAGERTQVFLGTQKHLVFVADLDGHCPAEEIRTRVVGQVGVYPHLVDVAPRDVPVVPEVRIVRGEDV